MAYMFKFQCLTEALPQSAARLCNKGDHDTNRIAGAPRVGCKAEEVA